jgi:hypothetical protein
MNLEHQLGKMTILYIIELYKLVITTSLKVKWIFNFREQSQVVYFFMLNLVVVILIHKCAIPEVVTQIIQ